jgi:transposase-like protein
MHCPKCQSSQIKKNGFRRGKQSYRGKDCGYQFVESPTPKEYPPAVKELCLKMDLNDLSSI